MGMNLYGEAYEAPFPCLCSIAEPASRELAFSRDALIQNIASSAWDLDPPLVALFSSPSLFSAALAPVSVLD